MDISRLTKDELLYELKIRNRNIPVTTSVAALRRILTYSMKNETVGEHIQPSDIQLDATEELGVCEEKTVQLTEAIHVAEEPLTDSQVQKFETKFTHLIGRLARLSTEDEELLILKHKILQQLYELEEIADEKRWKQKKTHVKNDSNRTSATETVNVHKKQVPVCQWGLSFNGEDGAISVSAFVEQVEEYCRARNVSYPELFNSVTDLLTGKALIWYRSVKNNISSWTQFVHMLREEYQSFDYEYELWNEIRSRIQGSEETVGNYFACMKNLFARLPTPASEEEKLQVLKRNIDPQYIIGLGLSSVESVDDLLHACKKLEINRLMADRSTRYTNHSRTALEPDLAYQARNTSSQKVRSSAKYVDAITSRQDSATRKCWNCQSENHLFSQCQQPRKKFCFGCGLKNVVKSSCPSCSKNMTEGTAHSAAGTSKS